MSNDSQKVPSQIFRWFEKMKNNYEQSVQSVLHRFEQYSHSQQIRIDKANQSHINNLQQAHQKHLEQQNSQINQLNHDVAYYKEQILKQQQTIEQLNGRYDAVMSCLLAEKRKDIDIKDIFSTNFANDQTVEDLNLSNTIEADDTVNDSPLSDNLSDDIHPITDKNELFDQAILKRQSGDNEQAFQLFEQAAILGHVKSMGAMGRSFFLGEGIAENHAQGLAWLIQAAEQALPQAISRVDHFKEADPELYQEALTLAKNLTS